MCQHVNRLLLIIAACFLTMWTAQTADAQAVPVEVKKVENGYELLRAGKPFVLKGAGGDWHLADDMIVRPDLIIICHGIPERHLDYAPALIVEVVSESTEKKDRTAKYDLYQQNGVETYVIVDPDSQHIDVFELLDGSYRQQDDSEDFIATLHGQQLVVSKSEIFD